MPYPFLSERYPQISQPERYYAALCAALRGGELPVETFGADDWRALGTMARREKVDLLLYWAWKDHPPAGIPKDVLLRFGAAFVEGDRRQRERRQELNRRILPALQGLASPVVMLKGGLWAEVLYPHQALRPMIDLDLLVRKEQLEEAVRRLRERGYSQDWNMPSVGSSDDAHHILLTVKEPAAVNVEMHHALVPSGGYWYNPRMDWFWQGLEPLENGLFMLDPTRQLFHLCTHLAFQHGIASAALVQFYDLRLLLEKWGERIDWPALIEEARFLGLASAVATALTNAADRPGTTFPAEVLETLEGLAREEKSADLVRHRAQSANPIDFYHFWFELKNLPWKARLIYLLENIAPQPAYMRWRYRPNPAWLWPLFYPLRWAQMIGQLGRYLYKQAARF